jgi:antirestriction protein
MGRGNPAPFLFGVNQMQIYVACLAAYNAGRLHGAWIDVDADADAMAADVAAMLAKSPIPGAEEYAVHDYDDFPNMGEYPGFDAIAETAALVEIAADIGLSADDFVRVAKNWHGDAADIRDALENLFCGVYDSFRDFADELADDLLHNVPDDAARYFDYDAHAHDLSHAYTAIDLARGVAVFSD